MRVARVVAGLLAGCCLAAEPVKVADFSKEGHGWKGNPRVRVLGQAGALTVELTGEDPWVEGPAVEMPGFGDAQKLALTLEADCDSPGAFQLFYAPPGKGFTEDATIRLNRVPGSSAYKGFIPAAAAMLHFRIDPPGSSGRVTLRALRALPLIPLTVPAFGRPSGVTLSDDAIRVAAGAVSVAHEPKRWNALAWFVDGQRMAEGNPAEVLAYAEGKTVVAVPLAEAETATVATEGGFTVHARVSDAGGAVWKLARSFRAERGRIRVETGLSVSQPREVVHLPWLTLFAGVGSFGEHKGQALVPGVEYLADEPSSNEKEVCGAAANRRLVAGHKVCYPLMALAADGRWLSMGWSGGDVAVSPLFDSPDRVFHSGGHVLGLWSPAVGDARFESEFVVYGGVRLEAGKTYAVRVTLSGGKGDAVTEAVGDSVARDGLPPVPRYGQGFDGAVRLLAAGWLDSAARDGVTWRHAVWGDHFPPQPAQDPPAYLLWLAAHTEDSALKARLSETARTVIDSLPKGCFGTDGVSHVKRPTGALLYGNLEGLVMQAGPHTSQIAQRLAEGKAIYKPGKADYASTLGSDHCNGFTAMSAEEMLVNASLTGDEGAIAAALAVLDKMTALYAGEVPRGAQPWEMPLHTPDILASARLVRCYTLGYLLSGRPGYLEQARTWAWTGVAMVYLAPPTEGAVGLYATIGVIGATNWQAPNWIGQPVQWCGLVYRSALEDLARVDETQGDTWRTLARGITVTGLQMCFPVGDPQGRGGLLPDYFLLRAQVGEGPAINPGTLQANLAEAYGKTPLVTVTRLSNGSLVHAPGEVRQEASPDGALRLAVTAWPEDDYRVLITRVERPPAAVTWNGAPTAARFVERAHGVIVTLKGCGTLGVTR